VALAKNCVTDPVLFQAVYEETLGPIQEPSDGLYSTRPTLVLQDFVIDERMSSSDVSVRKLKRSKTINISSLTSISDPPVSNRKAKRTKSMRDADDLTQITTPGRSNGATEKDPWEFPSSGASDQLPEMSLKVKSRNSEKVLKTYGRPIQRSQTIAHGATSPSMDWAAISTTDSDPAALGVKRSPRTRGAEDLPGMLPEAKRHKRGMSVNGGLLDKVLGQPSHSVSMVSRLLGCFQNLKSLIKYPDPGSIFHDDTTCSYWGGSVHH
jgi:hypothetical protein